MIIKILGKNRGQDTGQLGGKERAEEASEVGDPGHWGNVRRRGPHTKVNLDTMMIIHWILFRTNYNCIILTNVQSNSNIFIYQETQESWQMFDLIWFDMI